MTKDENQEWTLSDEWKPHYQPQEQFLPHFGKCMEAFTVQDITEAINNLGNNKAPGVSGLSHDILKLIRNNEIKEFITHIANDMKENLVVPTNEKIAKMINLPKIMEWAGQRSYLRPITLLETFRKIISKIMNDRITGTIDTNNILKGFNYGFRTGQSTTEALLMIRSIIDLAQIENKDLYIASLDIKKAYDTVPFEGLKMSLIRIGMPENLVNFIMLLTTDRKLTVDTAYGESDPFTPTRGLPQGEVLSCILWSIFYDPLLVRLQEETKGYELTKLSNKRNISAVGFADDLYPISTEVEDSQKQLDIIGSFLNMHNMEVSPSKSKILTNKKSNRNNPLNMTLTINGKAIDNILPGDAYSRILGVFWTLDGKFNMTIKLALEELEGVLQKISMKYTPGKLATYILNACVIQKMAYRLQLIYIPDTWLDKIDMEIRKVARRKNALQARTRDEIVRQEQPCTG